MGVSEGEPGGVCASLWVGCAPVISRLWRPDGGMRAHGGEGV
jgi:hypothetical protein